MLCFTKRKKGKDLVGYMKNKYSEKNFFEEICPKCSRNSSAFLWEFMRMRVEWCNIMPTTVMLVTCALRRRNGTLTKRNIFNGAFMSFLHLFANWNIFGSGHALLLQCFLFQNAISHKFYSNFPSFTPSINV